MAKEEFPGTLEMKTSNYSNPPGRSGILAVAMATSLCNPLSAETWNYLPPPATSISTYNWDDTATWVEGTIPDAPGAVANVSTDIVGTLGKSIRLNATRTVGTLTIGDTTTEGPNNYLANLNFSFGGFIFDNNGAGAVLQTATTSGYEAVGFRSAGPAVTMSQTHSLNDNLTIINNMGPNTLEATQMPASMQLGAFNETGGARSITVEGANGITSFVGASTYSGGTNVTGGIVVSGNTSSFGTGDVTISSGAQVSLQTDGTWTNNFDINGNGWTDSGGHGHGAIQVGAANTTAPKTQTLSGTINIASNSRIEAWSNVTAVLSGALTGTGNLEINGLDGTPDLTRNGVIQIDGDTSGFSGDVTVTQGRLDVGSSIAGDVNVSNLAGIGGSGTIGGNLNLGTPSGGPPLGTSLVLSNSGALGVTGNVDLATGTTTSIVLSSYVAGTTTALTYGGALTGAGTFDLEGGIANYKAGTTIDTSTPGEVKVTYVTGDVTWNGGNGTWAHLAGGWVAGQNFTNGDNVIFDGTNHAGGTEVITLGGNVSANTITVDNALGNDYLIDSGGTTSAIVTGAIVKNGEGVLTFDGGSRHTFDGGLTINAGRVQLDDFGNVAYGPFGTGTVTMNGGALSGVGTALETILNNFVINDDVTFGNITNDGDLNFRGNIVMGNDIVLNIEGDSGTDVRVGYYNASSSDPRDSQMTDNGNGYGLTKTGDGTLIIGTKTGGSVSASWAGTTSVREGKLWVDGTLESGAVTVKNGAILEIDESGSLVSTGSVIVQSGGLLDVQSTSASLIGTIDASSVLIAEGASLIGKGTLNAHTTIRGIHGPGASPGVQTFSEGLTYAASGMLTWELNGNADAVRGTAFDGVDVTGGTFAIESGASMTVTLSSSVDFLNVFWTANQEWLVVDLADTVTGDGGTETLAISGISGGLNYSPSLGYFETNRITDGGGKNDLVLNWVAVPEPSVGLLSLIGFVFCTRRNRKGA